jgi:putative peptidoglycan lipid II flippase
MLSVVGTLLPTAAAVVLGYRAEGGVAVFTMAFAFFVLPHALVAVPVATTVAPRVAEASQSDDVETIRQLVNGAAQVVVPLLMFAGTAMVVLSWPVARVAASIGDAASQGYAPIAHTVAVFGIGLVGYGMAFVGARVLFALNDVKRTSLLVSASACVGVVAMVIASGLIRAAERSVALAVGYVIAQVVSAALLTLRVRSVTGAPTLASIGRLSLRSLTAALLCACVMVPIRLQFGTDASSSLVAIVVAGIAGGIVFIGAVALLLGSSPRTMLRQIGRV